MQIAQASDVGFLALHAKQTQHQRQKKRNTFSSTQLQELACPIFKAKNCSFQCLLISNLLFSPFTLLLLVPLFSQIGHILLSRVPDFFFPPSFAHCTHHIGRVTVSMAPSVDSTPSD